VGWIQAEALGFFLRLLLLLPLFEDRASIIVIRRELPLTSWTAKMAAQDGMKGREESAESAGRAGGNRKATR